MSGLDVLDVRLTALADAIRARDWERTEHEYDRVRSTIARELGVRERESDRLRRELDATESELRYASGVDDVDPLSS